MHMVALSVISCCGTNRRATAGSVTDFSADFGHVFVGIRVEFGDARFAAKFDFLSLVDF
jgi:hypothetical protein